MKQKILFGIMTAVIFGSLFVGLKFATAVNAEAFWLDPQFKTVNPTSTQLTFLYDLRINTTYTIQAWEVKLLYDPAVLRAIGVVWGTYFAPPENVSNVVNIPGTGESIRLGQSFTWQGNNATGEGLVAQINFTYVLPGKTEIRFLTAKVLDTNNDEYDLLSTSVSGKLLCDYPHPAFTWTCQDWIWNATDESWIFNANPLPNHTIAEGGDTLTHYDTVQFNASASFDASNIYWNATTEAFEQNQTVWPGIVSYEWDFGDGTTGSGVAPTHVYQSYNQSGWLVVLNVTDDEGDSWLSTWRYKGPKSSDTVPMWRDVAVVDIWPSLDWLDNVHHIVGRADNATYWGEETFIVMVTAVNLGSVPERCKISLYALYLGEKVDFTPNPPYRPDYERVYETNLHCIATWWYTLGAQAGSGFDLIDVFTPPANGKYLLFATIEFEGAMSDDGNQGNNYFMDRMPVDTIWTPKTEDPDDTYAGWCCDLDGDGTVGPRDFAIFAGNYGWTPPPMP